MKKVLPAMLAVLYGFVTHAQGVSVKATRPYKVVGYYLLNTLLKDSVQQVQNHTFLDRVTHVNIAFINPDTAGNFRQDLPLRNFIDEAHNKNVLVLPSIAGGGPHTYYSNLLRDDKRQVFVANLVSMVMRYGFDGVDVDLEGNDIDSNYEAFVTELSAALKPAGKIMSAAIATVYKDKLSDKALDQFDFLNIMSYDRTGPWNPRKPGHHSPYTMAEEDLEYWNSTRSIPKNKLVLGLPFYGYGFGSPDSSVVSMSFKDITNAYPNAANADSLLLPNMRTMYFNGTGSIRKKTELAAKKASGIMIWQLSGDGEGESSLLSLINRTLYKKE